MTSRQIFVHEYLKYSYIIILNSLQIFVDRVIHHGTWSSTAHDPPTRVILRRAWSSTACDLPRRVILRRAWSSTARDPPPRVILHLAWSSTACDLPPRVILCLPLLLCPPPLPSPLPPSRPSRQRYVCPRQSVITDACVCREWPLCRPAPSLYRRHQTAARFCRANLFSWSNRTIRDVASGSVT